MKKLLLLFCFLIVTLIAFSQPPPPDNCPMIVFSYDAAGNRIQRNLVVVPCGDIERTTDTAGNTVISTLQANVYPNPAKDKINIDLKQASNENETKVFLYDLNGKIIYETILSSAQFQINVSNYSNGKYLLKIVNGKEFKTYNVLKS